MEEKIITTCCLCDDLLKALGIVEDAQVQMSNAEVMTVALSAALFFSGNFEHSRAFLSEQGYMSTMLSKSRFNRRLREIPESVWLALFCLLATVVKQTNEEQEYIIDSFPVPVCDNIRIRRCKIYHNEAYRGRITSKCRYFYGLRVHLLIAKTGEPVEFVLAPGSYNDCRVLKQFEFDLPEDCTVYADGSFNDYRYEDLLKEFGINFKPIRKKNSKRAVPLWVEYVRKSVHQRV